MTAWNIAATYVGSLTPDQAETIGECLSRHDGAAANIPPDRFTVSLYRDSDGPEVMLEAANLINKSIAASGASTDGLCGIEVVTEAELERRAEEPNYLDLVSAGEVAEILNVKRQRVHQLSTRGRGFPEPVYELAIGKLWEASAIEAYAAGRNARPGRPAAAGAATFRKTTAKATAKAAQKVVVKAAQKAARRVERGAGSRSSVR